jgi:hypothetical protein
VHSDAGLAGSWCTTMHVEARAQAAPLPLPLPLPLPWWC